MKNLINYLLIALSCMSCHTAQKEFVYISVLADKTSEKIASPQRKVIKDIATSGIDKDVSINFAYQIIGNTDFNKRYTLMLAPHSILENTLKRKADVNRFYSAIDTLLLQEEAKTYQYQNSSIFIPLLERLVYLSKVKSSKKIVLLYSDIFEYSDVFNCYSKQSRELLYKNPEAVVSQFQARLTGENFKGIELYIIYYPTTITDNRLFQNLYKVYRKTFKGTGLKIYIGIDEQLKLKR